MTHLPSTKELLTLEARLEEDGFSEHDFTILSLISSATSVGAPPNVINTLADTNVPEMTRRGALRELIDVWPSYIDSASTRPDPGLFSTLLNAWRAHQELRKQRASVAELYASRGRLDEARTSIARNAPRSGCGLSPC